MRNMLSMLVAGFVLFSVASASADYTTGFNTGEGFADGDTIVGVDNWARGVGCTTDLRGVGQDGSSVGPAPYEGDLYVQIHDYNGSEGKYTRELSASEQVGTAGETYTAEISVSMAAHTTNAGSGLLYVKGDADGDHAAVFGFKGAAFVYNDGDTWTTTGTFTVDTWYKFDAVLHGNGSGGGIYDLTISGGDLGADIVLTGIAYRYSTVDYIGNITIYSSKGSVGGDMTVGEVYFDDLSVANVIGYTTGFNTDEGYTDGITIVGDRNWAQATGCTTDLRGLGQDGSPVGPAPYEGDLYAQIHDYNGSAGKYTRELSASEQIGATGETYTGKVSVAMAAHTTHAGDGLLYVQGSADHGTDAAVFGFQDASFMYNDGGTWTTTGTFTVDTWYKFDAVLYGNGSGGGTYDLTISGGDLGADIVLTDIVFRYSNVDYIGNVSIYSIKGSVSGGMTTGEVYFDDLSVALFVPPPPPPSGTLIVIQ